MGVMKNSSRHASLAEQLRALMEYRNRPQSSEPLQTNWTTVPTNDNADPEEVADFGFERHLRITPSVAEIARQIEGGDVARNGAGQIVAIGALRFSDGTNTERAYCYGPDGKVVEFDERMPIGSMLGTRDKTEGQLGGKGITDEEVEQSNLYFAHMLGTVEPRYIKRTARKNGKSYTSTESRQMLAEALANTPVMPAVRRYKAGLPCGGKRASESFLGMQKGKKGESGAIMWQDVSSSIVQREVWEETLIELAKDDIRTLDVAMKARSLREIGEAHGFVGKRAERMGKRILQHANDNLSGAKRRATA